MSQTYSHVACQMVESMLWRAAHMFGDLLHTTTCSGCVGRKHSELMLSSTPDAEAGGPNVCMQSHVFASQIFTEPSLDPVTNRSCGAATGPSHAQEVKNGNAFAKHGHLRHLSKVCARKASLRMHVPHRVQTRSRLCTTCAREVLSMSCL